MSHGGLLQLTVVSTLSLLGTWSAGQSAHSDLRFWYDEGKIQIETDNGLNVGVGDFATAGVFRQYEANPGFASELDAGMGVDPGDAIVYDVLDGLWYWDGQDFATPAVDVQIRVGNNAGPDTVVSGISGEQIGRDGPEPVNFVANASAVGNFHSHVEYFLEPYDPSGIELPDFGVYGLKFSLSTSAVGVASSDPFFFVFNFGLSFAEADAAIAAYAAALDIPIVAGDYDADGEVDLGDYGIWTSGYGSAGVTIGSGADGNADGMVNAADYTVWRDAFTLAGSAIALPEPSAFALALAAAGAAALRKRQGRPRS